MWPKAVHIAGEDGRRALLKADEEGSAEGGGGSGVLDDYAAEFARLRGVARDKFQHMPEASPSTRAEAINSIEKLLSEMESNRRQVQTLVKFESSGSASVRQQWTQRLPEWTGEISSLRGQLERAREDHQRMALDLPFTNGHTAERERAVQSTEMMERSSSRLEDASRVALETESLGAEIIRDLHDQREVIARSRDNMRTVGSELSSARRALDRMNRMAQQNKCIVQVIGTVFAIGITVWILCILGLSMKLTIALATALVAICAVCRYLRQRWRARGQ